MRQRLLGPHPVLLLAFVLLLLGLVGAFAYFVVASQDQSRRQSEQRFDAEASLTAQLTASLFTTSATSSQSAAEKSFGGRTVDPRLLRAPTTDGGAEFIAILGAHGNTIASTLPKGRSIAGDGAALREALSGSPTLSGVLPAVQGAKSAVVAWNVPFNTPYGRRVEVEGIEIAPISKFLASYLAKARGDGNGAAFILDSNNRVVASSGSTIPLGGRPKATTLLAALAARRQGTYHYSGADRYFSSSPVQGSLWRVVLTVPTTALFPALAGSESWVLYAVLAALALAGLASAGFFRRALVNGAALASANANLVATNLTLEERVAERTAAAEARARELARSNEELEQFSSVASHDLQEPLRKIRMFGDRLRERLGDTVSEEAEADLGRMQGAAERMQRLINDLLDYSRVSRRGKEFERVDLRGIATEVVSDLEARIVELDAQVELGELPTLEADPTQMRQLLQNLIGNALKFHRDGEPPRVRVTSEVVVGQPARFAGESATLDRCSITVADNGIGFDEKHAERIFTAFERLHGRSSYEGTGIGLSIARKIAWRHGGHIVATGAPSKGATFTVTLPLSQNGSQNGESHK